MWVFLFYRNKNAMLENGELQHRKREQDEGKSIGKRSIGN